MKVNKLYSTSFGFRAGISTFDALIYRTESFRCEIDKNKYVTAAFLHLSKAFDSIQHDISDAKIRQISFDKFSTRLIMDFN